MQEYMRKHEARNFHSLENIGRAIAEVVLDPARGGGARATVEVVSTKTEIRAAEVRVLMSRARNDTGMAAFGRDTFSVKGLRLLAVIGVFTFERLQRQIVSLDIDMTTDFETTKLDYHLIIQAVVAYVESLNFKTVEALVLGVNQLVTQKGVAAARVRVEKPNAITFADGVGVTVEKAAAYFKGKDFLVLENPTENPTNPQAAFNMPVYKGEAASAGATHVAYVAFGTNQGNAVANINRAVAELNARNHRVLATSALYESRPMYHLNQPNFVNGVLKLETTLDPFALLSELQDIEANTLGRVKLIENGPRTIDLDILLYDQVIMNTPTLIIPHMSMLERTFVLQPLCELVGPHDLHPVTAEPFHNHRRDLFAAGTDHAKQASSALETRVPLQGKDWAFSLNHSYSTRLMGVLNTTPDSFSDGGTHLTTEAALARVVQMVEEGAQIIDIGGVSTRPGSSAPSEAEEIARVVPLVRAVREAADERVRGVALSIDTYRSRVAQAALDAGADIINDISGGLYDEAMFGVVAAAGAPYVLGHTRGTPETMSALTTYEANTDDALVEDFDRELAALLGMSDSDTCFVTAVARELAQRALAAQAAGVAKWQVILDPNLGFAKDTHQDLTLIRFLPVFRSYSLWNTTTGAYFSFGSCPLLMGPSRKRFIGAITNVPRADARVMGTAAAVTACIAGRADIVRVHDIKEMKQVCSMGDAIFR